MWITGKLPKYMLYINGNYKTLNTKPMPNEDSLERAKKLVEERKAKRLSLEEIAKEEKEDKVKQLHAQYSQLTQQLGQIRMELRGIPREIDIASGKISNLKHGQSGSVEILKNEPDTGYLFKKDTGKDKKDTKKLHQERQEVFDVVFQESQKEKRVLKKEKREVEIKGVELEKKEKEILEKIKQILASEMGGELNNLILKNNENLENENRNSSERKEITGLYWESVAIKKLNAYVGSVKEKIEELESQLRIASTELLTNLSEVFKNKLNSPEYKELAEKEVFEIETIEKMLPKKYEDLRVSVYSYDSDSLSLPKIDEILEEVSKLRRKFSEEEHKVGREAWEKQGKWFSGVSKLEKIIKKANDRRKIMDSLHQEISKVQREFSYKKLDNSIFKNSRSNSNTLGNQLTSLLSSIRYDVGFSGSELGRVEPQIPQFKKEFLLTDLSNLKDGIELTTEQKIAIEKYEEFEKKLQQSRYEAEVLRQIKGNR
ncbi:hypothetical protein A2914_00270 [Candidatus Nomurabacteria bacterium RIFCSPLOWO2_01_FULL_41_21]|uniref:Uncharacterized protein n=2 Tax=Candidatus Nomuraibacteriota TaxID=1752729 RepID=A0A1F6V3C6_9BACT|nr:MAG: hypothetical protein A2733_02675 [Candidatus Nomurabacteria bacterium RIFCSPHIGHO2_01_FULL_40_20]OGI88790.1 MAG: hypothetical protein A2914_00270 [Candidatus Nomurabacteria bacterium RIFCSPLOWO2_01_FULL_41_21]